MKQLMEIASTNLKRIKAAMKKEVWQDSKDSAGEDQEDYIEFVADKMHEIWIHWMGYLFSQCLENEDGSATIPKDKVDRWKQQMLTPYTDLTEKEKDSDREQAYKIIETNRRRYE